MDNSTLFVFCGGFQDMWMEGFKARPLEGPGEGLWSVRDMSWFQARGPVGSEESGSSPMKGSPWRV